MFCNECGFQVADGPAICPKCGKPPVVSVTASAAITAAPAGEPSGKASHSAANVQRLRLLDVLIGLPLILLYAAWFVTRLTSSESGFSFTQASVSGVATWIGLWLYTWPTRKAIIREKRQWKAITLVNVLLGWSVLGWIASMAWAVSED
jgi:hypothetical protein